MKPEEFVCWLDGYRQAVTGSEITSGDWERIIEALDSACRYLHFSRKTVITIPGDQTP